MIELAMKLKGDTLGCTIKNGDIYSFKSLLLDNFMGFFSRYKSCFRTGILPGGFREIFYEGAGRLHVVMESPPGKSHFLCRECEKNECHPVTCPPLVYIVTLERSGKSLEIRTIRVLAAADHPLRSGTVLYPFTPIGEGGWVELPPDFHKEGWGRIDRLHEIAQSIAFMNSKIPIRRSILTEDNEIFPEMLGDPLGAYEKLEVGKSFTLKSEEGPIDSLVMELDALGIIKVSCPGEPAFHVPCREFLRLIRGMNVSRSGLLPSATRELVLGRNSMYLVVQGLPISRPATCCSDRFRAIPYPEHIFVFEITKETQGLRVSRSYIFALMESSLQENTKLYRFPFSNVYDDHSICFGSYRDFSLASLQGISSIIQAFYTLGYNQHLQNNFRPFKRKDGFRIEGMPGLFRYLDGKVFPHSILMEAKSYSKEMDAIFPNLPDITGYDTAAAAGPAGGLNQQRTTLPRELAIDLEADLEYEEL